MCQESGELSPGLDFQNRKLDYRDATGRGGGY